MAKVKTSVGEFEINNLTWKQIKEAGLFKVMKKIGTSEDEADVFANIDEEDIERAVKVVAGDKIDEMSFTDVMAVFQAMIERLFETKK